MQPTEIPKTLTRKTGYLIILGVVVLQVLVVSLSLVIIKNKDKEILSLKTNVSSAKVQSNGTII